MNNLAEYCIVCQKLPPKGSEVKMRNLLYPKQHAKWVKGSGTNTYGADCNVINNYRCPRKAQRFGGARLARSEKTQMLMVELICRFTQELDVVVDFFMGSASAGAAWYSLTHALTPSNHARMRPINSCTQTKHPRTRTMSLIHSKATHTHTH